MYNAKYMEYKGVLKFSGYIGIYMAKVQLLLVEYYIIQAH